MKPRSGLILALCGALACARSPRVSSPECPRPLPQRSVRLTLAPISSPHAQLRGRVVDATDSSAIPAAPLTLEEQRSHRGATSSDSAGRFLLDSLSPGRYVLITHAIGFGVRRDTVELRAAAASILLIPLNPIPAWECGRHARARNPHRRVSNRDDR
jgi:Carboxypeptidase regulatory-like domain